MRGALHLITFVTSVMGVSGDDVVSHGDVMVLVVVMLLVMVVM